MILLVKTLWRIGDNLRMEYTEYLVNPMEKSLQDERLQKLFEIEKNIRHYKKGQMVYWQGEHAKAFYYLKEGEVKVYLSSENGTEKIVAMPKKGSVFGEAAFFDGLPRMSSACAVKPSEIIAIEKKQLLEYFKAYPDIAVDMLKYLSKTVRMLSSQVDNMAFLQADRQIARMLLTLKDKNSNGAYVLCSQEELAQLIGVSRVTVSRILNRFSGKGWIKIKYRAIEICDEASLSTFAE